MAIYRTAQGKSLDMSALAARNERTRAVGNMKVNARGDTIDSIGKVLVPAGKKAEENYHRSVSTTPVANQSPVPTSTVQPAAEQFDMLEHEIEIENDSDAVQIEQLKLAETAEFEIKPASEAPEFFEPTRKGKK